MFTDSIEANVETAQVHVGQGTEQLQMAKEYQVKSMLPCISSPLLTFNKSHN